MGTSFCWIKYVNAAHVDGDWATAAGWITGADGYLSDMRVRHQTPEEAPKCRSLPVPQEMGGVEMVVLGGCPCCTKSASTWLARFEDDEQLQLLSQPVPTNGAIWQLEGPTAASLTPDHDVDPGLTLSPAFPSRAEAQAWLNTQGGGDWGAGAQGMWLISHTN